MDFDNVWSSCANSLVSKKSLLVPLDGVYFFSLCGGLQNKYPLTYSVVDTSGSTVAQVSRKSSTHNASDTISKDTIVQLSKGQKLYVVKTGCVYDSRDYLLTSWSVFRMTEMFSPLYLFSSRRSTSQMEPGVMVFDDVTVDTRGVALYNSSSGVFNAVADGVYFFAFTTGVPGGSTQNVTLNVNGVAKVTVYRGSNVTNDIDTLSRSVLLELSENDEVTLSLEDGELYGSKKGEETTFTGFLYSPSRDPQHCWSVYLDHNWISADNGTLDPIPLKNIAINRGGLFTADNSSVKVKVAGLYYVYASVGLQPGHKVYIHIMHNEDVLASVARFEGYQNGEDEMGRGILVEAEEGDTFHLWEDECPDCAILADSKHRQTTFMGFLIHSKL